MSFFRKKRGSGKHFPMQSGWIMQKPKTGAESGAEMSGFYGVERGFKG